MFWRRFMLVAFVIVFAASPIRALELSSFPTELTLTPSEAGFVAVRVTASGDSPVAELQLNPYAPEDLKPELVKAPSANSLSAGGAAVWIYRLRREEGGSRLGSVLWRLDGVEQRAQDQGRQPDSPHRVLDNSRLVTPIVVSPSDMV